MLLYLEEWILDCRENPSSPLPDTAVELYNLNNDPDESHDLAPEQTSKRDELLGDLIAWRNSMGILAGEMKTHPNNVPK